ncbi:MAG: DsbA family protein [Pseudomonadota bacterium]
MTRPRALFRPSGLRTSAAAALIALAATAPAGAQEIDFSQMSESDKAAFGEAVRQYIMDNPEVIGDALLELRQRADSAEREAEGARVRQYMAALHETSYSWAAGDPEGDVTIVKFSDYRCAFCKRAHPTVKEVLALDDNVRLIVKEYPILGEDSVVAGQMAMAAYRIDPDLYGTLNDQLMIFQGQLTETAAYRIADAVGYDVAELKALANSTEIEEEIEKTYRLADALGVRGTPTFIVGDRIVRGAVPTDELLAAVQAERDEQTN